MTDEVDFAYLEEIEAEIDDVSGLELFCQKAAEKQKKIREVQRLVDDLKGEKRFDRLMSEVILCEQAEFLLSETKKAKNIEDIGATLEKTIETDPYKAFDLMQALESKRCSLIWMENLATNMAEFARSALLPIFTKEFAQFIQSCNWPFQSKGEILSLSPSIFSKFTDLFKKLSILNTVEHPSEILITKMKDQISFHFLTEKSSNKIEKPEWLLEYSINSIRVNICYFLEQFELGGKVVEKVLQMAILEIVKVISKRISHDTLIAMKSNKEVLFLHIIDEVLRFDMALNEFKSNEYLLAKIMTEKDFSDVWISYEKYYILIETNKMFTNLSWEPEQISGLKYNNVNEIILLHNSLMIKYSYVFVEDIQNKLINNMNSVLIESFINAYLEAFAYFKTMVIHYESNPELWVKICCQVSALHQSCVLFQQFILNIDKSLFAEAHFKLNGLKKEIVNKLLHLLMFTLEEIVSEYKNKSLWKESGTLRVKTVKKMLDGLKKTSTIELNKLILSYTAQKIAEVIVNVFKSKSLVAKHLENALSDFKILFVLLQDDTERYAFVVSKITKA